MNKIKISLLATLFMLFQQVSCADNQNEGVSYFPEYTTKHYVYNKSVINDESSYVFRQYYEDVIKTHPFDSGITRTKTTEKIENGVTVKIVETWTSQNPSYVILTNVVVTACLACSYINGVCIPNTSLYGLDYRDCRSNSTFYIEQIA